MKTKKTKTANSRTKTKKSKFKKIKTLEIERSKWLCGELTNRYDKSKEVLGDAPSSRLLNKHGQMCCLGFYARACGLSAKSITDMPEPLNLPNRCQKPFVEMNNKEMDDTYDGTICEFLIQNNDDDNMSPKAREKYIAEGFNKLGITVKYTGTYPTIRELIKLEKSRSHSE